MAGYTQEAKGAGKPDALPDEAAADMDSLLPAPSDADKASITALNAFLERTFGARMVEAELRATCVFDSNGRYLRDRTPEAIANAITQGVEHPDYARIAAPALSIYAVHSSVERAIPSSKTLGMAGRARLTAAFSQMVEYARNQRDRFRREMTRGRVVEIDDANHYVFISHSARVLKEMRGFLTP